MADILETHRTVTPYLVVPDADAELRFLASAFGATEQLCQRNADHSVAHAEVRIRDSLIMLGQAGENWKALPAALYLWIANVDEVYWKALAAGATSQSVARRQTLRTPQRRRGGLVRRHLVDRLADSIAAPG